MHPIKAILFDLDGTLLDTLQDLTASTNYALHHFGFPERSLEEVRSFVGNGVRRLMKQAVPPHITDSQFEEIFSVFKDYYFKHCNDYTQPYPHIMTLLQELKRQGIKMGVVSNKWHLAVEELCHQYFPDTISIAIGESEKIPRKPSPEGTLFALQELQCQANEVLYVGDSDIDIMTAQNAGIECISVTWGFRNEDFLKAHHAKNIIRQPLELLNIIRERKDVQ